MRIGIVSISFQLSHSKKIRIHIHTLLLFNMFLFLVHWRLITVMQLRTQLKPQEF